MAVTTFTKRQIVADTFPEFLAKRGQVLVGIGEAYAKELGVPRMSLGYLSTGWQLCEGEVVSRSRFGWRSPYSMKQDELVAKHYAELARAGIAEPAGDGWRLTRHGFEAIDEQQRRVRAALRDLSLPAGPTRRAAVQLARLASRIPPSAERAGLVKRLPLAPSGEPASDVVDLNRAVIELWSFRDDCHIAAWQAGRYDGPTIDVLTQVWTTPPDIAWATGGGISQVDDLVRTLDAKQDRADVERNVDALVRRGDLVRDDGTVRITAQGQRARDTVEEDTDRRYFVIWDLDDAQTARLGDDLRAVIDTLPKG